MTEDKGLCLKEVDEYGNAPQCSMNLKSKNFCRNGDYGHRDPPDSAMYDTKVLF